MDFVCIDFEAEYDLHGEPFPVEVGVCRPGNPSAALFIRPEPSWRVDERRLFNSGLWDEAQTNGKPARAITSRLKALSIGRRFVSDAAFFDSRLLKRLGLELELFEFFPLADQIAKSRGISSMQVNSWINEIDDQRQAAHRAGPDAWVRAELLNRLMNSNAR